MLSARYESPNLDLLRATAVLLVLVFHLLLFFMDGPRIPYYLKGIGRWGVLLFFVHTCFVLMLSLERQQNSYSSKSVFWPFMIRRCFRVYPLSMVIVLTVYLFHLPVGNVYAGRCIPVQLHPAGLISNLTLTQNFSHQESIVAPLWSLPYEMQMYLFLPLLYLITRYFRSVVPVFGMWFFAALAATVAARSIHLQRTGVYDFLIYVPCFLSGIIGYKLSKNRSLRLPFALWPLAIGLITFLYLSDAWNDYMSWTACLLIGILIPQFCDMTNPAFHATCHTIAKYSYGVYLTHFILIWWGFQDMRGVGRPLQWFLFLSATIAIPVFLYHVVEEPMIRLGSHVARHLFAEKTVAPAPAL